MSMSYAAWMKERRQKLYLETSSKDIRPHGRWHLTENLKTHSHNVFTWILAPSKLGTQNDRTKIKRIQNHAERTKIKNEEFRGLQRLRNGFNGEILRKIEFSRDYKKEVCPFSFWHSIYRYYHICQRKMRLSKKLLEYFMYF